MINYSSKKGVLLSTRDPIYLDVLYAVEDQREVGLRNKRILYIRSSTRLQRRVKAFLKQIVGDLV